MGKRRWKNVGRTLAAVRPAVVKVLRNPFFLVFLSLSLLGWVVGRVQRPETPPIPYDQLFENLHVLSYRDTPSDTVCRFVVELYACGRAFRQIDVDSRRFMPPARGTQYVRAISGTRYRPLRLRGHADHGFWLELPDSLTPVLAAGQFDELYQKSLDYVRPFAIVANVLGVLSGYSIGHRIATWEGSLCNPRMQERLLASPGIERLIALEAWRRVLLEPALMGDESNTDAFSTIHEKQRVYANFYRLALRDTSGFIARETARLAAAGEEGYARAMSGFATAVGRARADTAALTSRDFRAIELWAGMLYGRGHWARYAAPAEAEANAMYLGALTWRGLGPTAPDERRIWVGPRVLVKSGDLEGFVADEIPATALGCPQGWRGRLLAVRGAGDPEVWSALVSARPGAVAARLLPTWRAFERMLPRPRPRAPHDRGTVHPAEASTPE